MQPRFVETVAVTGESAELGTEIKKKVDHHHCTTSISSPLH